MPLVYTLQNCNKILVSRRFSLSLIKIPKYFLQMKHNLYWITTCKEEVMPLNVAEAIVFPLSAFYCRPDHDSAINSHIHHSWSCDRRNTLWSLFSAGTWDEMDDNTHIPPSDRGLLWQTLIILFHVNDIRPDLHCISIYYHSLNDHMKK